MSYEGNEPVDRFIAHVLSEPEVFRDSRAVEPAIFDQTMARDGGRVHQFVGVARHLRDCVIDGVSAQHVLVQPFYGFATLIFIPRLEAATTEPCTKNGYTAVVISLRRGNQGIVAASPERVRKCRAIDQTARDLGKLICRLEDINNRTWALRQYAICGTSILARRRNMH